MLLKLSEAERWDISTVVISQARADQIPLHHRFLRKNRRGAMWNIKGNTGRVEEQSAFRHPSGSGQGRKIDD